MLLSSFQFMFILWGGMVVAVSMDSLKAKLNVCLHLCAHSLPLFFVSLCIFVIYVCFICLTHTMYVYTYIFSYKCTTYES